MDEDDSIIEAQEKELGKFLKECREDRSISLWEIPMFTKISLPRIADLEFGRSRIGIRLSEASKLANLYQLDVQIILDMATGKKPDGDDYFDKDPA